MKTRGSPRSAPDETEPTDETEVDGTGVDETGSVDGTGPCPADEPALAGNSLAGDCLAGDPDPAGRSASVPMKAGPL